MFLSELEAHIAKRYTNEVAAGILEELRAVEGKHYDACILCAQDLSNDIWNKNSCPTFAEAESDGIPDSENHIQWMLGQVIGNQLEDSYKARAWLAYCQGVAVSKEWVELDDIIKQTRQHMQSQRDSLKLLLGNIYDVSSGHAVSDAGMARE